MRHFETTLPEFRYPDVFTDGVLDDRKIKILALECMKDLKPDAGPGLPFTNFVKTNEELLENDFTRNLLHSAAVELFKLMHTKDITKMSVPELIKAGVPLVSHVFIKQEPHPLRKVEAKRFRLICSMPVLFQLIERMAFTITAKARIRNWTRDRAKPGIGFTDEMVKQQFDEFAAFLREHGYVLQDDVSGWDFSVRKWLQIAVIECWENKSPPQWHFFLRNYASLSVRFLFALSNGVIYHPGCEGLMHSGKFVTSMQNSDMRNLVSDVTGIMAGASETELGSIAMGDDCVETPVERDYASLGIRITDEVLSSDFPIQFCSHKYLGGQVATLESWPRMIYKLLGTDFDAQKYSQIKFELRHNPELPEILELLDAIGWTRRDESFQFHLEQISQCSSLGSPLVCEQSAENSSLLIMARKGNRVKQKLRKDGRAIAAAERGIHRERQQAKARANASERRRKPAARKVVNLLGSRELQETAWVASFSDCESYAARVPITQVTGAVPVDLYRVSTFANVTTNSSHYAYAMMATDSWHDGYVGAGAGTAHLHADGATAYFGAVTGSGYTGATFAQFPAATDTAATGGVSLLAVPDISSDFTSNSISGTEYISVGIRFSIKTVMPPAGSDRFVGEVWAISTLDPERAGIAGAFPSSIYADSLKEGSLYRVAKYRITGSGLFVPVEAAIHGNEADIDDAGGVGELHLYETPLSTGAYKWRRCGVQALQTTAGYATVGFYVNATAGTVLQVRSTELWQSERYASALVRRVPPAPSAYSTMMGLAGLVDQVAQHAIPGLTGGLGAGVAATLGHASSQPGFGAQLTNGLSSGINQLSNLVNSGGNLFGAIQNAYVNGSNLWESLSGSHGPQVSAPLGSNWRPGLPPSMTPGTVEVLPEEGGTGIIQAIEGGVEDLSEYAPELLSMLA